MVSEDFDVMQLALGGLDLKVEDDKGRLVE
jgi:hypothetical protein